MKSPRLKPKRHHFVVYKAFFSLYKCFINATVFGECDSIWRVFKVNLKSMSIDKLAKLKDQVDTILRTKVADERRTLQAELGELSRFSTSQLRSKGLRLGARGPVAPKYRNPENPSETWAGRGLRPRWLAAAIKAGKKLEHFSIAQTAKRATKKAPKKVRKAKKR